MKINGKEVVTNKIELFAYDGCHKIYILESNEDLIEAQKNYLIMTMDKLKETYEKSCPLKFIHNWKLDKNYAEQGKEAIFEED